MLKKIASFSILAGITASYYYLRTHPLSITNPLISHLLTVSHQYVTEYQTQKPQYSINIFKILLQLQILQTDSHLNQYILRGFDIDGHYIQQIQYLGFKGIQIGPTSFNPSVQEQRCCHLGIKSALASIYSYRTNNPQQCLEVHLNIVPNYEVLKFAPYLLKQNLMHACTTFSTIQEHLKKSLTSQIIIQFDHPQFKLSQPQSLEVIKLIEQTKKSINKQIDQLSSKIDQKIQIRYGRQGKDYMKWEDFLTYIRNPSIL